MVGKSKPELEAAGYMTSDGRKRAMDKTAAYWSAAQYICLCSPGSQPREMEPLPVTWLPLLNKRNQDNPPEECLEPFQAMLDSVKFRTLTIKACVTISLI